MSDAKGLRIVCFCGYGRSGSTLLARMLGEADGVFNCGEFPRLFHGFSSGDLYCSCGEKLARCPVWGEVQRLVEARVPQQVLSRLGAKPGFKILRYRDVPFVVAAPKALWLRGHAKDFADALKEVYLALAEVTGARVLVDATKWVPYAALTTLALPFEQTLLHLVRDGRAAAYSWAKRQHRFQRPDGSISGLPSKKVWYASLEWVVFNAMATLLCQGRPSLRVRYEDLIASPKLVFEKICREMNLSSPWEKIARSERELRIEPGHGLSGNPNVWVRSEFTLKLDDEWQTADWGREKVTAAAICLPGLLLNRYPLWLPSRKSVNS